MGPLLHELFCHCADRAGKKGLLGNAESFRPTSIRPTTPKPPAALWLGNAKRQSTHALLTVYRSRRGPVGVDMLSTAVDA